MIAAIRICLKGKEAFSDKSLFILPHLHPCFICCALFKCYGIRTCYGICLHLYIYIYLKKTWNWLMNIWLFKESSWVMPNKNISIFKGKNSSSMLRAMCSGIHTHLKCINTHKWLKETSTGKCVKAMWKYTMCKVVIPIWRRA